VVAGGRTVVQAASFAHLNVRMSTN